jgi:hypothetical protein
VNFFKSSIAYRCRALYVYAFLTALISISALPVFQSEQLPLPYYVQHLTEGAQNRLLLYLTLLNTFSAVAMTAYLILERNRARLRRILILFSISAVVNLLIFAFTVTAAGVIRYCLVVLLLLTGIYILRQPGMGMKAALKRPFGKQAKSVAKSLAWFLNMYMRLLIILMGVCLLFTGIHIVSVAENFLPPVGLVLAVLGLLYLLPYYLFTRWFQVATGIATIVWTAVTVWVLHVQFQTDLPTLDDLSYPLPPLELHVLAWTLAFKSSVLYITISTLLLVDLLLLRYRRLARSKRRLRAGLLAACAASIVLMLILIVYVQNYEYPYPPDAVPAPAVQEGIDRVTSRPEDDPELIKDISPKSAPTDVPQAGETLSAPEGLPSGGTVSGQPQNSANSSSSVDVSGQPRGQSLRTTW